MARTAQPPDDRLAAIEAQLSKLVMEVSHLSNTLDPAPAHVPREQERLEVDRPPAKARPKAAAKKRAAKKRAAKRK